MACLTNIKAKDQFQKQRVLSDESAVIRHKCQKNHDTATSHEQVESMEHVSLRGHHVWRHATQ